jgi:hypothetical protein
MKTTWPSCRGRWGTASAALLAALLFTFGAPASAAGIADTKHNLGANSTAGNNKTTDTAEICVFCHTPHGADTGAPVPLWNKRLGTAGVPAGGGTYTSYATLQTPSLDGTIADVGSISMACLSCHDGTQAMDNIINAPGSGGVLADGGGNDGRAYTWTGSSVNGAGRLASGIALLGTDLSNDHPIGIQYCGGGLSGSGAVVSGTCKDSDFKAPLTAVINSNQIFWVETGTADNTKTRTDLPLYQRTPTTLGPLVECASCHDPHVKQGETGPNGQIAGETFLRISNASSAVCTACHVK